MEEELRALAATLAEAQAHSRDCRAAECDARKNASEATGRLRAAQKAFHDACDRIIVDAGGKTSFEEL